MALGIEGCCLIHRSLLLDLCGIVGNNAIKHLERALWLLAILHVPQSAKHFLGEIIVNFTTRLCI